MENKEIKRTTRPEAHDCNECQRCQRIKHDGSMEYERNRNTKGIEVAIKIIPTNSSEVFKELYIQRAMFSYKGYESSYVSKILGITQNAETLEYGIVMEFAEHGDMRKYLSTNFHSTSWDNKLGIAYSIARGLSSIHSSGMVHRDLHSGNILQLDESWVDIGDLGLCQPTNNEATTTITTEEKKIFGVIPYIPPEVLRGEKFTTAGDIYSLGMLLWELSIGKPPFHDCPHDEILIMAILNGQRPNITSPLIPPSIGKLIKKCWDANPKNRPTARELTGKFMELLDLYNNHIFRLIYFGKSNILTKIAKNDSTTTKIAIHPEAVYTSRLLTAQIVNFSTELVYLPESNKVEKNFE
ncbi:hypothetical protein G9A89_001622 [Geosiphon pyriformis]|nr:hypothetical protein G9A89_001622 [Geosiphon pyriformis]